MEYIQFVIYVYLFIILFFISFYVSIFIKEKIMYQKYHQKKRVYKEIITKEINNMTKKQIFSDNHICFLQKELININHLLLFEEILIDLEKKNKKEVMNYCMKISSAFSFLIRSYRRKSSMEKAYFTYVLSMFPMLMHHNDNLVDYAMMSFVFDPSIYCRENAMLFFFHKGSSRQVIYSLKKINKRNLYYSPKLLADDLLQFSGNHEELASLLLEEFNDFSIRFQIAILHYIRLKGIDRKEDLYQKLLSKKYDKEVELAIIRYFARYKYDKVLKELLHFMHNKNAYDFEYRIVTAFALATYDTKEVRKILIHSLADCNWYVRKNAANSLVKMNVSIEELKQSLTTEDTYAREMLQSIWEEKLFSEDTSKTKKGTDLYAVHVSV